MGRQINLIRKEKNGWAVSKIENMQVNISDTDCKLKVHKMYHGTQQVDVLDKKKNRISSIYLNKI